MVKNRLKLLGKEYWIFTEHDTFCISGRYEYALFFDFSKEADLTVYDIGYRHTDIDTAVFISSIYIREHCGFPLGEYSLSVFDERIDIDLAYGDMENTVYTPYSSYEITMEDSVLNDLVKVRLLTARYAGFYIRIMPVEDIYGVAGSLLSRLRVISGLRDCTHALAVKKDEGKLYIRCSDYPIPPCCYWLVAQKYGMPQHSRVISVADGVEAHVAKGGTVVFEHGWM